MALMAGSTGLHLILPWRRDMDPVATFGHSPFPRWYKPLAYHSRRRITHIEAAFTANALIVATANASGTLVVARTATDR